MFPVFSLVLDEDVPSEIAMIYPELYKDLAKVQYRASASTLFTGESPPHMLTC